MSSYRSDFSLLKRKWPDPLQNHSMQTYLGEEFKTLKAAEACSHQPTDLSGHLNDLERRESTRAPASLPSGF